MNNRGYDRLAGCYRLLETLAFGRALERARCHHFERLRDCKRILLLGDGDGRGLALACRIAPRAHIDSIDSSAGMLARAARRLRTEDRKRVTFRCADAREMALPAATYDAVTTLFFLDCFSDAQVSELIGRIQPALTSEAVWLYADFALPPDGWRRLRAQGWLALMFTFFRWQTRLSIRSLPASEHLLQAAGLRPVAEASRQGGFIRSVVFRSRG